MKYVLTVLIIIGLVFVIMTQVYQSELDSIKTYRIYYGQVDETILEGMKAYDMVVVEALHFNAQMVETLHQSGVVVIGYISVSEVGSWDDALDEQLDATDYINRSGGYVFNGKNKLGDLTSVHFRSALLETVDTRIHGLGMDGVFFDTLDSINVLEDHTDRLRQAEGYYAFIEDLRTAWQEAIFIQNRGFDYISALGWGSVDGILWENFNGNKMDVDRYQERSKLMREIKWTKNIRTLALSYEGDAASRVYAQKKKWLYSLDGQEGLVNWNQ